MSTKVQPQRSSRNSGKSNVTSSGKRKVRYTDNQLEEFCLEEVSIECTKCKKVDGEYNSDLYFAAPNFFSKGWRATSQNCYCPECAKKYLKLS